MQKITNELSKLISEYAKKFSEIPEIEFYAKPYPEKWSKKEIVGHLIDSAHNNLRRFIAGQIEESPHIVYDQDFWVRINNYQAMPQEEIILLWKLLNERICVVLSNTSGEKIFARVNTGKETDSFQTIEWLADDYIKHLKHHINQIFPGAFDIVYS